MKKITLIVVVLILGLASNAQRNPDISIERYYHIQKGKVWFHALGKNFYPISMGEVKTEEILIYNSADVPVSFTTKELPDGYSLKFIPDPIPPKTEARIEITFDTQAHGKYGPLLSYFYVYSSIEGERPYRMLMSPNVLEDFSVLSEKEKADAPVVTFDKTESDFGTLPQMSVFNDVFVLTNTGKSDLIIRNVKAGCGCTHTNTSRDIIPAGESAELAFEYRTLHKRGTQDSKITVVTNDPNNPQMTLHIKGTVTEIEEDK
ncbi:MAG: hypothetical protein C0593_03855 [Marinilabiliales bacterium]|nr:MAG: hypothetical protein C0593_03855 [Marinilabiliales bacterium]